MPNTRSGSIEVLHLSKQFLQRETGLTLDVLNDISFCAEPGTFLALVGESGCGKTTLLRILAGLECADHGIVQINGKAVSGPNADCGMMFQQNALFPWLTVRENIEFGPKMLRKSQQDQARINELLQIMRLEDFSNVYPAKISGGMQQRAALARALANDPSVLLLDEPLGALDAFTRMRLQDELIRIWQWQKNTMLMITHDIDEAVYLAQKVIILTPRPKRTCDLSAISKGSNQQRICRITERDSGDASFCVEEFIMNKRNEQLQTMSFEQLHARSVEFHGHSCPGLIIGIKAAMYVMELFHEAFSEDEELVCVAENDACGVDAIQSILGCSVGKGNLLFRMRGKHAYTFYCRKTGQSARLVLRPLVDMTAKEKNDYLCKTAAADLFEIKPAQPLPEKARIFKSMTCECCGEQTAEYYTRNENGKIVCLDCVHPYNRFLLI